MLKPNKWNRLSIISELHRPSMAMMRFAEMNGGNPFGFSLIWLAVSYFTSACHKYL